MEHFQSHRLMSRRAMMQTQVLEIDSLHSYLGLYPAS